MGGKQAGNQKNSFVGRVMQLHLIWHELTEERGDIQTCWLTPSIAGSKCQSPTRIETEVSLNLPIPTPN